MTEGEESAGATAGDYQREAAAKDREYDSSASALEGNRELNAEETARLKPLWKKLVRMFHPDLPERDPEKRKTYELHDVKSYDRIMDGRIIFEDCWIR